MARKATIVADNHFRGPTDVPFEIIVADVPWSFGDQLKHGKRGASSKYSTMSLEGIKGLLPRMEASGEISIAKNAILFLWGVESQPAESLAVARAWGFLPKTSGIWVKTSRSAERAAFGKGFIGTDGNGLAFGMGRYLRGCHEPYRICTRGSGTSLIISHSERSILFAPVREHSEKPEEFFQMVERLVGPGRPSLELFARGVRPGYTTFGDQAL